jgi:peptidoglycan/xylan/chitin deacetylase (PgdA/CDA1 family)
VSIAFDDNMQNQYDYAFPLLKSRGMVGTFYVVTDYIRDFSLNGAYMSIAELQDLQNHGCEIASHSKTHPHFTHISDDQIYV